MTEKKPATGSVVVKDSVFRNDSAMNAERRGLMDASLCRKDRRSKGEKRVHKVSVCRLKGGEPKNPGNSKWGWEDCKGFMGRRVIGPFIKRTAWS